MNAKYTERIQTLINELNVGICERENVTKLALLCAVAGVRVNISGPRGTAKNLIAGRVVSALPASRRPDISVSSEPDPDSNIVMRLRTAPIASEDKFIEMAFSYDLPKTVKTQLSETEVDSIRAEAKKVQIPLSLKNTYIALHRFFAIYDSGCEEEMKFDVHDALWPEITAVLKTAALLNGRSCIDAADITLISNCFWTKPAQISVLKPLLDFVFNNLTMTGRETINHLSLEIDNFSSLVTDTFFHYRPAQYDFEFINGKKFWKVRASEDGVIVYISEERSQRNDGLVAHEMYFNGEIGETEGYFEDGDFVSVTQNARFPIIRMQGTGYATPKSEIYCNAFSTAVNDFTNEKFIPLNTQLESAIDSMTAIVAQSQERYKKDLFASPEAADKFTFSQIESLAGLRELRDRLQSEYIRYARPLLLAAPAIENASGLAQNAETVPAAISVAGATAKSAQEKEKIVIAKAIPLEDPPPPPPPAPEPEPPAPEPPAPEPPVQTPPVQEPPQIETPPAEAPTEKAQPSAPAVAPADANAPAATPEAAPATEPPAQEDKQPSPATPAPGTGESNPEAKPPAAQTEQTQTPTSDAGAKQPPATSGTKSAQPATAPKAPAPVKKKVILGPNGKPLILPKKFKFVIPKKPAAK